MSLKPRSRRYSCIGRNIWGWVATARTRPLGAEISNAGGFTNPGIPVPTPTRVGPYTLGAAIGRGGDVTYHGPGQLIVYLLINLRRRKLGVREIVDIMEKSLVALLADYGIEAYAKPDAPGVYVGDAKIASLGLRVRRGCSFHGLALNLDMNMEPFLRINPCGYAGMPMTQLSELTDMPEVHDVMQKLGDHLVSKIGYTQVSYSDVLE